jgi:hypothetical protein
MEDPLIFETDWNPLTFGDFTSKTANAFAVYLDDRSVLAVISACQSPLLPLQCAHG